MLWNTFDNNREKLDKQYRTADYKGSDGLEYDALLAESMAIVERECDLPLAVVRSHVIKFLLENAKLNITPCEWFVDDISGRDITDRVKSFYYEKYKPGRLAASKQAVYEISRCAWTSWPDLGHNAPDWEAILSLGLVGLRDRVKNTLEEREASSELTEEQRIYYTSILTCYEGVFACLKRMAAIARARADEDEKLPLVADNLEALCDHAPETMLEAMQLIFTWYMIQMSLEASYVRTLGTLDVLLYPFYKKDLESGRYTREQLRELVRYFIFHAGAKKVVANMPFALCGVDADGKGYVNELSYIIMEEYRALNIYDPKIHIRYSKELPRDFITLTLDCIRDGKNSIVFINSPVVAKALECVGAEHAHAVNYTIVGCYETCAAGKEVPCTCNGRINIPKAVEAALCAGYDILTDKLVGVPTKSAEEYEDYDSFFEAVKVQLSYYIDQCIKLTNDRERLYPYYHTSPFYSSSFIDSVKRGLDIYEGGALYNNSSINAFGVATAADALLVIKKFVFEEKRLTLSELRDILKNNWEGNEQFRLQALKLVEKYGNNHAAPDAIARELLLHCSNEINGRENGRGGVYRMGSFSIDWRIEFGKTTGASADGRRAHEPISKNVCADTARDYNGATAHILSAVNLDYTKMPNGTVLDIVMHSSAVSGEDGMEALYATLLTFMERDGFAIQYNVLTPDVLVEAQKNPEQYSTLQIRLCGWNVLFVDLPKHMQDEFIASSRAQE